MRGRIPSDSRKDGTLKESVMTTHLQALLDQREELLEQNPDLQQLQNVIDDLFLGTDFNRKCQILSTLITHRLRLLQEINEKLMKSLQE